MSPIITLTTDFGVKDGYVGAMKGVILSICPQATIVDITHDIPPQDVASGAYVLSTCARFFPPGTIHVGVVDPGVGTMRRSMVLFSGGQVFVGPDNGLFSFAVNGVMRGIEIFPDADASPTFHGRDLFGPVAAKLATGMDPAVLGPEFHDPLRLSLWKKTDMGDRVQGHVIHIDRFGNAITNLAPEDFGGAPAKLYVPGREIPEDIRIFKTYAHAPIGSALWLVGSEGRYELAVQNGNAADAFGVKRGDKAVGLKNP